MTERNERWNGRRGQGMKQKDKCMCQEVWKNARLQVRM